MTWQQRLWWLVAPVSVTLVVLFVLHPKTIGGRGGWWLGLALGIAFALYQHKNMLLQRFQKMWTLSNNGKQFQPLLLGEKVALPEFTPMEKLTTVDDEATVAEESTA